MESIHATLSQTKHSLKGLGMRLRWVAHSRDCEQYDAILACHEYADTDRQCLAASITTIGLLKHTGPVVFCEPPPTEPNKAPGILINHLSDIHQGSRMLLGADTWICLRNGNQPQNIAKIIRYIARHTHNHPLILAVDRQTIATWIHLANIQAPAEAMPCKFPQDRGAAVKFNIRYCKIWPHASRLSVVSIKEAI